MVKSVREHKKKWSFLLKIKGPLSSKKKERNLGRPEFELGLLQSFFFLSKTNFELQMLFWYRSNYCKLKKKSIKERGGTYWNNEI